MGRHTSVDEADQHPLVTDALRRRPAPRQAGTHRGEPNVVAPLPVASSVGWPVEPGRGEGLGWPDGAEPRPQAALAAPATGVPGDNGPLLAAQDAAGVPGEPEADTRRSGWRRFFGGGPAATESQDTSAA